MQLASINDIETRHRHIFLSPHYDDAVYACGGTLGVQVSSGLRPLVVTIFGGKPGNDLKLSPFAEQVHISNGAAIAEGPDALIETRRKEDAAALDYLQCDYLWLDYKDALYRGTPANNPYYTNRDALIGGEVHPGDQAIDQDLANTLLSLRQRLPDAVWYAPLGIGRHVDHQIVSSASDRLVQDGAKVYFYEDFPYVTLQGAREARLKELGNAFEPTLVEISELLSARQEAAEMYGSQIVANFGNREALLKAIDSYSQSIRPVETIRLERYWLAR
ncbi:PIG-L deacetylase family protein [Tengunoibacter tsumagoiensis]|uniref:GlcNAc-PI de-N-acetylase n=1 Tax=Tengunoibacter tsumagoiensis TaxID=2014871 RepID=A0A402A1K4_9CHLR|nr:PIG-L family deacetylase [Tengunoibacter tsumagoiensis]GCE13027.1 GlcNAc-PI de-N-acetylase [Tengunoibacter tsumagoiensis]